MQGSLKFKVTIVFKEQQLYKVFVSTYASTIFLTHFVHPFVFRDPSADHVSVHDLMTEVSENLKLPEGLSCPGGGGQSIESQTGPMDICWEHHHISIMLRFTCFFCDSLKFFQSI